MSPLPDSNPKTRFGIQKPGIADIPMVALLHLGQGMRDGKEKYGRTNWREHPVTASVYFDAAFRHLAAWWDGEQVASDSKVHHLGHAMACLAIIVDAEAQKSLNDDRPSVPGQFSAVAEAMRRAFPPVAVEGEAPASDVAQGVFSSTRFADAVLRNAPPAGSPTITVTVQKDETGIAAFARAFEEAGRSLFGDPVTPDAREPVWYGELEAQAEALGEKTSKSAIGLANLFFNRLTASGPGKEELAESCYTAISQIASGFELALIEVARTLKSALDRADRTPHQIMDARGTDNDLAVALILAYFPEANLALLHETMFDFLQADDAETSAARLAQASEIMDYAGGSYNRLHQLPQPDLTLIVFLFLARKAGCDWPLQELAELHDAFELQGMMDGSTALRVAT